MHGQLECPFLKSCQEYVVVHCRRYEKAVCRRFHWEPEGSPPTLETSTAQGIYCPCAAWVSSLPDALDGPTVLWDSWVAACSGEIIIVHSVQNVFFSRGPTYADSHQ